MRNDGSERLATSSYANRKKSAIQSTSSTTFEPLHPERAPARLWEVDWKRVEAEEHWRATHWRAFANIEFTSTSVTRGAIEYRTCRTKPAPKAGGGLEFFGPDAARHIAGTLLQRCAGYREAPQAQDVAAALRSDNPDEQQARALKIYLYEASAQDVREAWKAGEFTLRELMSRARSVFGAHAREVPHSICQWTERVVLRG